MRADMNRMNQAVAAAVLLVALCAAGAGSLSAQELRGPRIAIPQERFDLGKIIPGGKAEHVFVILNEGDQPLVIEQIRTS